MGVLNFKKIIDHYIVKRSEQSFSYKDILLKNFTIFSLFSRINTLYFFKFVLSFLVWQMKYNLKGTRHVVLSVQSFILIEMINFF